MVKKKTNKGKMKLIDEIGEDDVNLITVSDNEYPPPEKGEAVLKHIPFSRHSYDLRHNYRRKWGKMSSTGWVDSEYKWDKRFKYEILCGEGITYGEYARKIAVKVNDYYEVGNYIPEGIAIELMCLYNGLPFVVRSTNDLRDMWAHGDESYPMRTHFYIKPTDAVKEMVDEVGEYVLLDKEDIDYIISPKETKEKNTTPVKATPVKTNTKRKGKPVVMSPSKPNKVANKPAKRQKTLIVDAKKTTKNLMQKSESECDDIDEEQKRWVRYAQVGADCLGPDDGYYNTHSSNDEDYVPTAEDLEKGNEFEGVDVKLDNIYNKEEDDKVKTPLTAGFKKLEVGMQWATVYEAREYMRRFRILNHFTYVCIKNDSTRLRLKCSQEKWKWLVFISRNNYGHTMVLKHGNFQHSCEGKLGVENTLCNAIWVAGEVESLVRNVRAMTPKTIKLGIDIPGANDYLEKEPYEHWYRSFNDEIAKGNELMDELTLDDLSMMKYTWRVANRTLRITPLVFGGIRKALNLFPKDGKCCGQ
ncbi:hypothetical protein GIB67_039396 [Kingdonia uniflora]|uniref:Transposase MuDR plant domain-containing protein n=1 Tax=Kingdonia uniflora TaxID=39325 RepID=A0A7J7L7X9_9MAGN|nr:hypothetical protein GIB67_001248 [Kingdonia uniflora]KAF6152208.1 hypothetical protein GIB67_039396 [Kingdonia uniflora]